MKRFLLAILTLSLCSCGIFKTHKSIDHLDDTARITSTCPPNSECKLEVLKDTRMEFKKDDIGKLFPIFPNDTDYKTIKYTFSKDNKKQFVDGHYKEEVLLQLPTEAKKLHLKDKDLQEVNLLFGRHCFCKGSAGYFQITEGELTLQNGELQVHFKTDTGKQVTTTITIDY